MPICVRDGRFGRLRRSGRGWPTAIEARLQRSAPLGSLTEGHARCRVEQSIVVPHIRTIYIAGG